MMRMVSSSFRSTWQPQRDTPTKRYRQRRGQGAGKGHLESACAQHLLFRLTLSFTGA